MVFINWKHFEATWEHLLKKILEPEPHIIYQQALGNKPETWHKNKQNFPHLINTEGVFFLTCACVCAHVHVCMRIRVEFPWHANQVREQFQESVLIVCLSWIGSLCYFWCLYASLANPWGSRGIPEWMKSWVIVCCCHGHSHVNDSDLRCMRKWSCVPTRVRLRGMAKPASCLCVDGCWWYVQSISAGGSSSQMIKPEDFSSTVTVPT